MPISQDQLLSDIQSIRTELDVCEHKQFKACAPATEHLRTLVDSWDKMQADMETLVGVYTRLIEATGPLAFAAAHLVATIRPSNKGRSLISKGAGEELAKALYQFRKTDGDNRARELG